MMRIAALGRTKILWNSIKRLQSCGHEIVLIATCKAAPEYEITKENFKQLAKEIGADFLFTQNLNKPELINKLIDVNAEIAVSVNWINIIGLNACNAFKHGILNAHAGDLPRYRGNAPIAWAILQGEEKIALTVHQMDPFELDAGPILLKDYFSVTEATYIGEVIQWVEERIPDLFLEAINGINNGQCKITLQPSDTSLSLRCYPRKPEDGLVDWNMPSEYLARLVRASSEPFVGAYTHWKNNRLIIWRARAEKWEVPSLAVAGQVIYRNMKEGAVAIATGKGILILEEIELIGQGRVKPVLVLKSLRDRLGEENVY